MDDGGLMPISVGARRRAWTNAAYDEGFSRARPRLLAICRSLVNDEAEDAVQETYLTGRKRLDQLRDLGRLEPWLARIAINYCYQQFRRRDTLARLVPWLPRPEQSEPSADLRDLIQRLPAKERTVLVLHYGHGFPLEEIGTMLGVKPATIRSQLFRARLNLRRQLSNNDQGQS